MCYCQNAIAKNVKKLLAYKPLDITTHDIRSHELNTYTVLNDPLKEIYSFKQTQSLTSEPMPICIIPHQIGLQ